MFIFITLRITIIYYVSPPWPGTRYRDDEMIILTTNVPSNSRTAKFHFLLMKLLDITYIDKNF